MMLFRSRNVLLTFILLVLLCVSILNNAEGMYQRTLTVFNKESIIGGYVEKVYAYNASIIVEPNAYIKTFYGKNVNLTVLGFVNEIYVDGGKHVYIRSLPHEAVGSIKNVRYFSVGLIVDDGSLLKGSSLLEKFFPNLKLYNVSVKELRIILLTKTYIDNLNDDTVSLFLLSGGSVENSILRSLNILSSRDVRVKNVETDALQVDFLGKPYNFTLENVKTANLLLNNVTCNIVFGWRKLSLYINGAGPFKVSYKDPGFIYFGLFNSKCNFSGTVYEKFFLEAANSSIVFDAKPQVFKFVENRWMYFYKTTLFSLYDHTNATIPWDFALNVISDNTSNVVYFVRNVKKHGNVQLFCDGRKVNSAEGLTCKNLYAVDEHNVTTNILCSYCDYYSIDWVIETLRNNKLFIGFFGFFSLMILFVIYTIRYDNKNEHSAGFSKTEKLTAVFEALLLLPLLMIEPWFANVLYGVFRLWPRIITLQVATLLLLSTIFIIRIRSFSKRDLAFAIGTIFLGVSIICFAFLESSFHVTVLSFIYFGLIAFYYLKKSVIRRWLTQHNLTVLLFCVAIVMIIAATIGNIPETSASVDSLVYTHYNQAHIEYLVPSSLLPHIVTFSLFWFIGYVFARRFGIKREFLSYLSIGSITALVLLFQNVPFNADQLVEHWDSIGVMEKMRYDPSHITHLFIFLGPHPPLIRFYTLAISFICRDYYFLRVFTLGSTLLIIILIVKLAKEHLGEDFSDSFAMVFGLSPIFLSLMSIGQTADRGYWLLILGILLLIADRRLLAIATFALSHMTYIITISIALPLTFLHMISRPPKSRKEVAAIIAYFAFTLILTLFLYIHARSFYIGSAEIERFNIQRYFESVFSNPSVFLNPNFFNIRRMALVLWKSFVAGFYAIAVNPFLGLPQLFSFLACRTEAIMLPVFSDNGFTFMEAIPINWHPSLSEYFTFSQIIKPAVPVPTFFSTFSIIIYMLSLVYVLKQNCKRLWLWAGLVGGTVLHLLGLALTVPTFAICCWVEINYFELTRMMPLVLLSMFLLAFSKMNKPLSVLFIALFLSISGVLISASPLAETPMFQLSSYGASYIIYKENATVSQYHIINGVLEAFTATLDNEIDPIGTLEADIINALREGYITPETKACAILFKGNYRMNDDVPPDYMRLFKVEYLTDFVPESNSRYFVAETDTLSGQTTTIIKSEKMGINQLVINCYEYGRVLEMLGISENH